MLVGVIWDCAARKKSANDGKMAVGGSKVERSRARRADYGRGCVATAVRVAAGESVGCVSDNQEGVERSAPGCVYVGTRLDEKVDDKDVPACTGCVEWEYAIEDRVDWLSMRNSVLDEADVARGGCGV